MTARQKAPTSVRLGFTFHNLQELIDSRIGNQLLDATRPKYFEFLDLGLSAYPEKYSPIDRRQVTCGGGRQVVLHFPVGRDQLHPGSNTIPIALLALKLQTNPVIVVSSVVTEDVSRTIAVGNHDIDIAVVVEVSERCTAASPNLLEHLTGNG